MNGSDSLNALQLTIFNAFNGTVQIIERINYV